MSELVELLYIKFQPRPKKDGLHDSGYRYIRLIGVGKDNHQEYDLGEWHDHLIVEPSCNIDVEDDGTIRIMPWSGTKFWYDPDSKFFTSIGENGRFR